MYVYVLFISIIIVSIFLLRRIVDTKADVETFSWYKYSDKLYRWLKFQNNKLKGNYVE